MSTHTADFRRLARPHRKLLALALSCMALNALATGAYAYLIGPVVKFFFAGGLSPQDSLAHVLAFLRIEPRIGDTGFLLLALPALILAAALIKGISQFGSKYAMGVFGERVMFGLRGEMLTHLHRLPDTRFDAVSAGDFITRMDSDAALLRDSLTGAIGALAADSLKIIVLLSVAVALDWRMALVSVCVLPLVAIPIVGVGRSLKATASHWQEARADLAAHVAQDVAAERLIKDYDLSAQRRERFKQHNRRTFTAAARALFARAAGSPLMELIGALGLAATLWFAGWRMSAGTLVPEHFVSFFAAILLMYEPMKNIGRLNGVLQGGRAGQARIAEMLGWEPEPEGGAHAPQTLERAIRFERVRLAYGERVALDGLSVEIRAGEMTALVGESGAGKSSLVRALLGHYPIDAGAIYIDDRTLGDVSLAALRRLITLVEQRPLLFDDTLGANIRLARPQATHAELERALARARLSDLVARLPQGLDTPVGEGGALLSEGEKQRVALARAFLRPSPVVVLDEVTAALDADNEAAIRAAIHDLARTRSVLVIAHRLSTVAHADHVIVMQAGRVVESGTPEALSLSGGVYAGFLSKQRERSEPLTPPG